MASVVVVENEIKNSVIEYGQIIDSVHQNTQFSDSLKSYFDIRGAITNKAEVAAKIVEASSAATLTKLSDKEFEPAFYLLVYLLSELEGASFETLLHQDSAVLKLLVECTPAQTPSVRDRRSLKPTTIMSILSTFFNFVSGSSPVRVHLLQLILAVVKDTQIDYALIQSSIGDNLVALLRAAHASDDQIAAIFWDFVKLDKAYTEKSLHLIKAFTSEFPVSDAQLDDLIVFALNSSVVDVSFLVNNNVAAALQSASGALAHTFVQYTQGELISAVPEPLPASVAQKSKSLALAKFFGSHADKNTFSYADIPSVLVSSPAEFEKLLIDSIKAGVIEGKLNQVDESFFLVRVNRFVLAGDNEKLAQDWATVRRALEQWKQSLTNINEIVNNAKENIVNNNSSN